MDGKGQTERQSKRRRRRVKEGWLAYGVCLQDETGVLVRLAGAAALALRKDGDDVRALFIDIPRCDAVDGVLRDRRLQ